MNDPFNGFERFCRLAHRMDQSSREPDGPEHPFDSRNIHPGLPTVVRSLFDSGHYSQATFEAFKFLEKEVRRHARAGNRIGKQLMMAAFSEKEPRIALTSMTGESATSEQEGYKFLFSGGLLAIRNPRGHEPDLVDNVDQCLDHITFVSMLLRRLAAAGFHVKGIQ